MVIFSSSFLRFALVGAIGTVVDFALFYGLHMLLEWGLVVSNILSYSTGLTSSFFLNRRFTFQSTTKTNRLWLSLVLGYIGLGINTALVWLCAGIMPMMLGKVIAVIVVLFYNYFANRYFVFSDA